MAAVKDTAMDEDEDEDEEDEEEDEDLEGRASRLAHFARLLHRTRPTITLRAASEMSESSTATGGAQGEMGPMVERGCTV